MARPYSLKPFLRKAPNALLREHLGRHGIGGDIKWGGLTEASVDRIARAVVEAEEKTRQQVECDFQEANRMADEGGRQTLVEEGHNRHHEVDLQPDSERMGGHVECALWTFIHHPDVLRVARKLDHADGLSSRQWRKRKDIPPTTPSTDADSVHRLEQALSDYYSREQGRGKACQVDHYERGNRLYWFAYPEDYAAGELDWVDGRLEFVARRPAFEVVLVYCQDEGSLDTWTRGGKKVIGELQQVFSRVSLGVEIGPLPADEVVYEPGGASVEGLPPAARAGGRSRVGQGQGASAVSGRRREQAHCP